ncbi:MAG: glycosyltransferase [Candidatus Omnitrophica bacterium]|nr:glycosyltransferase [Candidatus Omnitrophota bacterium]
MKISGFTIAWNVEKYDYPFLESIKAILPICDEFIVNVGKSEDNTLGLVKSLNDPKIKIIETVWDPKARKDELSYQTNIALKECKGDWAFYVQADELIHEADLPRLKKLMTKHLHDEDVDAFRFKWLHFFGSYHRYRIDGAWFQKQDRIIRNNGTMESCIDAWTFQRKDGKPLRRVKTDCLLYHYGWVHPGEIMTQKRVVAEYFYAPPALTEKQKKEVYDYGDLNRFAPYFGSHPAVMKDLISVHSLSAKDWRDIERRYWWHPMKQLKARYKTSRRVKADLGT